MSDSSDSAVMDDVHASRSASHGETELASKMLQIQSKRFYLDVKQNARGRFIKMAEVGAGGRKSRLLMSMSTAAAFRDLLDDFVAYYEKLPPPTESSVAGPEDPSGQLKSEILIRENRRYFIDLKENSRGRFLRISQTAIRGVGGARSQIAMPAQGIAQLREELTALIASHGQGDNAGVMSCALPEGRHLRADNKIFYLDVGENHRGVFMRVSEVKSGFRSSITIPQGSWPRFREIFDELSEEMAALHTGGGHEEGEQARANHAKRVEDKLAK